MGGLVLAPILPQLMQQFGTIRGAPFLVPMLLTIPALCTALFSAPAGYIGDMLGKRKLLIGATVVYSVVGIAPAFLHDIFAILATRVAVGICEAAVLTLSTTLIGDLFSGRERGKWLAAQTAVASSSAVVFLLISGVLAGIYGWRGSFLIYGVTILLAYAIWRLTWEPARAVGASADAGRWSEVPWRKLGGICAVTLVASVLFYTVQIQTSSALVVLRVLSPARIGLLTAIASLGVPVGTFLFWRLSRLMVPLLLLIEFASMGVAFLGMGRAEHPATFLAWATLNQVGAGMILPTLLTWAINSLPFGVRGRGTGLWQAVFSVGQFGSGLIMPAIAMRTGGILPAFQYLGLTALACAAASLVSLLAWPRRMNVTAP